MLELVLVADPPKSAWSAVIGEIGECFPTFPTSRIPRHNGFL